MDGEGHSGGLCGRDWRQGWRQGWRITRKKSKLVVISWNVERVGRGLGSCADTSMRPLIGMSF